MDDKKGGSFLGFVLLKECEWCAEGFFTRLEENWGIVPENKDSNNKEQIFVFDYDGMHISAAFVPAPVPNGEAEHNAAFNYLWRGAVQETAKHKAQIIVSVLSGSDKLNQALTFVKVCESAVDENTVGIYTNGVVYEPDFYIQNAQLMQKDELPLLDLVWLGMSRTRTGINGYTMGLENFGKKEIEVLDCKDKPSGLLDFMYGIAGYVIGSDVTLNDGETIGFSAEQKLKITLSPGKEFDFPTLKIEYPQ